MLSVIIPVLNPDAELLARVLACLDEGAEAANISEIIIADGGSHTPPQIDASNVKLITGASGRGVQMAAGADEAKGDWLLFLHADTWLSDGWHEQVAAHMNTSQKAAVFRFQLNDDSTKARLLERIVSWRCRLLALPYGDQGLLISRQLYDEIGGFKPLPLMEDVDIIRRIGRDRLTWLQATAITSARRYRREGYVRRMARNLVCLTLWSLGVSPDTIKRIYG